MSWEAVGICHCVVDIPHGAKTVLMNLAQGCDDKGYCFPSHAYLARYGCMKSKTTVKAGLAWLMQQGTPEELKKREGRRWVKKTPRQDAAGDATSNAYELDLDLIQSSPCYQPARRGGAKSGIPYRELTPGGGAKSDGRSANDCPTVGQNLAEGGAADGYEAVKESVTDPIKDPKDFCAEPPKAAAAPAVDPDVLDAKRGPLEIPMATTSDPLFRVKQSLVAEYQAEFPMLDVHAEMIEIRRWNIDHPRQRKTRDGMRRHITAWLKRSQNNPKSRAGNWLRTREVAARRPDGVVKSCEDCRRPSRPGRAWCLGHEPYATSFGDWSTRAEWLTANPEPEVTG